MHFGCFPVRSTLQAVLLFSFCRKCAPQFVLMSSQRTSEQIGVASGIPDDNRKPLCQGRTLAESNWFQKLPRRKRSLRGCLHGFDLLDAPPPHNLRRVRQEVDTSNQTPDCAADFTETVRNANFQEEIIHVSPPHVWLTRVFQGRGGVLFEAPRGRNCIPPSSYIYIYIYTPPTPRRAFSGVGGWGCIKSGPVKLKANREFKAKVEQIRETPVKLKANREFKAKVEQIWETPLTGDPKNGGSDCLAVLESLGLQDVLAKIIGNESLFFCGWNRLPS